MKAVDADVLAGYDAGIEKGRLRKGIGLSRHLPAVSRKREAE